MLDIHIQTYSVEELIDSWGKANLPSESIDPARGIKIVDAILAGVPLTPVVVQFPQWKPLYNEERVAYLQMYREDAFSLAGDVFNVAYRGALFTDLNYTKRRRFLEARIDVARVVYGGIVDPQEIELLLSYLKEL